jgi:murein DD-endopeptidase MepM/ murein hydrolase activator NlpD
MRPAERRLLRALPATLVIGSALVGVVVALRATLAQANPDAPASGPVEDPWTLETDPLPLDAGVMTGDAQAAAAADPALVGHFVFIWPLPSSDVNSGLGWRTDPVVGPQHWGAGYHRGLDLAGAQGTLIRAMGPGRVVRAGWNDGLGQSVTINHPDSFVSIYGHMSAILVVAGMRVDRGAPIGLVGATGHATGPHLHLTLYHGDKLLDPTDYIGRRSDEPDPY